MIDIGGDVRLHLVRAGPADASGPTVLLEAGAFGFSADWAAVQEKLAARSVPSLAYDRAGLGFSDSGPAPRDGLAIAGDLERLLAAARETGPLVLCGHSMAGLHLRLFASRNASRIAGIVLVDATTPEAMDAPLTESLVGHFGAFSRLAAWGAEMGLFKPLAGALGDAIGLDGPAGDEKRWAFAQAGHNRWAAQEVLQWPATARQAREAGVFDPRWPVAVILAGGRRPVDLKSLQAAPARASVHGLVEAVGGASHATVLSGVYADAIVRGVEHVLAAARETIHEV
jgi:pimeloyl-ACP methyl ester carboxylesterase